MTPRFAPLRSQLRCLFYGNVDRLIMVEIPERHGWDEDGSIMRSQDCFPKDIDECLQGAADDTVSQDFDDFEVEYELEDFVDLE